MFRAPAQPVQLRAETDADATRRLERRAGLPVGGRIKALLRFGEVAEIPRGLGYLLSTSFPVDCRDGLDFRDPAQRVNPTRIHLAGQAKNVGETKIASKNTWTTA